MISKIMVGISRVLVGTLFIFSGVIKANDPLGFSYKLEEYWIEFGMAWDWLIAIGVPLASFICILEIILGVAVLVAYRMEIVTWLLLLMIVFFSILTFASAVFGLVKSCGCFGDAIPLTPWQSFIKDLILLAFILILFVFRKSTQPMEKRYLASAFVIFPTVLMAYASHQVEWNFPLYFTLIVLLPGYIISFAFLNLSPMLTVVLSLIGSTWLCAYSIGHLPMRDFRPYAVGKSISGQMKLPPNAKPDVYKNVFKYRNKSTGEVKDYDESNYPWDDENFEFVDRTTTLVEKGDEAKISDFSVITEDGMDITHDILDDPEPIVVVVSYNISGAEGDDGRIQKLIEDCYNQGMNVIGLSASDQESLKTYKEQNGWELTFYSTDGITLKTAIRSNPGIMLLKEGTVLGKWHINDTPDFKMVEARI